MNVEDVKARSVSVRKCFVISPIGSEGSEQRQHADDVYDFIIEPAMDEWGLVAVRSDGIAHPGRITDQMFRSLLQSDLCIAIVTFDNPNVFYELAIAHAASKPVIMLNMKGHALPFDVKDMRCLEYEYSPRPLATGRYAREVSQCIRGLELAGWQVPDFLATYGSPMGLRLSGETILLARSDDYSSFGGWDRTLDQARSMLDMAGMILGQWRRVKGFSARLRRLCEQGCQVRILLMDPKHPLLRHCFNPAIPEIVPDQTMSEMAAMSEYFREIVAAASKAEFRLMRMGICSFEITRTDEEVLLQPFVYSERPGGFPLWGFRRGSPLYALASQEFNALWDINRP